MQRFVKFVLVGAICGFCGWFWWHFDVRGLDRVSIKPRGQAASPAAAEDAPEQLAAVASAEPHRTVRVASFNLQAFGTVKLGNPQVMHVLGDLLRRFDVIALQDIRSNSSEVLPRLVAEVSLAGGHYDFVLGQRVGRVGGYEQFAFVYNRDTLEIDASGVYTVADRDALLNRDPLVAWFRVRGPAPTEAFTFTLVNVHTDAAETARENNALANVYRAVRDDGRGEDDIILLGDFGADGRHLGQLGKSPRLQAAIAGVPTTVRRDQAPDNILINATATIEFAGRAGVVDLVREYNLTAEQALAISAHVPVWAEFSLLEGRQNSGRLALGGH